VTKLARTSSAIVVLTALAFATPKPAAADVVPPPPTDCPKGEIGETSHNGPRCVKQAPKDCPAGWRGMEGGTCKLTPCTNDGRCWGDEVCVEHAVCLSPTVDEFYAPGEDEGAKQGTLDPADGAWLRSQLFGAAAPAPMPRRRPKPITRYEAVNVCSREVACAAPATCQRERLCVPKGVRALAYRGTNVYATRVARKTETPLTTSGTDAMEGSADPPATAPGARGCGSCAAGARDAEGAWVALAAAALALVRRRRRAHAEGRPLPPSA
jgi:MYXO-CTERM domain-containing protein